MANIFQNITDWFNGNKRIEGNIFNRSAYEYTAEQVEAMFGALEKR